jgi:hypothetical protein
MLLHRFVRRPLIASGWSGVSVRKRCRRCALPPQSKTWRRLWAGSIVQRRISHPAEPQTSLRWFVVSNGGTAGPPYQPNVGWCGRAVEISVERQRDTFSLMASPFETISHRGARPAARTPFRAWLRGSRVRSRGVRRAGCPACPTVHRPGARRRRGGRRFPT